ncbi:MAG TPA: CDP-alcohol phosphatidyltransferase family protein [bacterium]|nr:CDP-alcohol phosphatidyltransferase family protein [bacterium]HMW35265.1 CDP-alcohol phosphatidyltransferase family protein [bacterium]HMY35128.1 CDP-alcohol phosphatidyltransferase family protein [bacterium]HMZ04350.1 CDP-alcohol phosphatidyltransferase family protein [bacterium]HNB10948.1 CDP-alcohol phosphatidyltransferase family protein [bacterium]
MKALIDARNAAGMLKLFDITLVERLLRQVWVRGIREIIILGSINPSVFRTEFSKRFPMTVTIIEQYEEWLSKTGDLVILQSDVLYDDRILDVLTQTQDDRLIGDFNNPSCPYGAHLSGINITVEQVLLENNVRRLFSNENIQDIHDMDVYIKFLRKSYVPTLKRIHVGDDLTDIENDLFEKTFKSGLEWIAIYGYKTPVRELTRLFSKTNITPNHVTAVAVFCRWVSIPFLFYGWIGLGLGLIVLFVLLDSLDGKLARMTFRFSDQADWIDHGSVLPTRLGWYAGLGWHYSSGVWSSQAGMLTIITLVCIVLDDLNWAVAKRIFKRTLFDITDFDAKAHLFTHRRNDMFLMLSGYLIGLGLYSFYLICGWVVVTWIWHCTRIVYLSNDSSLSKERN